MAGLVLVTGGARSGKSAFALEHASGMGGRRAFLATAEALDDEMKERIALHKEQRGADWTTVEEPLDLAGWFGSDGGNYDVVVLDCLTIWLSNVMHTEGLDAEEESGRLVDAMDAATCGVVAVTNEVGMGIVPESAIAREFRDLAGRLNRLAADKADEVYLMVAGMPLTVKKKGEE
jgi:adenosylcobinamide kinase/adenosylcobinamide-phosphate guanylyltransferase